MASENESRFDDTLATFTHPRYELVGTGQVYDGLLEYGFDLKPKASLAESWEVTPDGKTVTFKLRKDVKFHDGNPFTSADVQFTVMEVLKKAHPRGISTGDAEKLLAEIRDEPRRVSEIAAKSGLIK